MIRTKMSWSCAVLLLAGCVDFYPDINEACDSAADRCPDNIGYTECVDDAIGVLDDDPESSQGVYDCLSESACDGVEACLDPDG